MDKDGVEDGDQGKNRKPWDHLSDYGVDNIYKCTGALRQQVPEWAQGNLNLALDLHCPGLRGKWGTTIYIVGSSNEEYASKQRAFMDILKQENKGEIKLHPTNSIIEYGTAWNGGTPAKTKKTTEKPTAKKTRSSQIGFMRWASQQGGDLFFGSTLEIPYAKNNEQMILPHNTRLFGKDLAHAIATYLQNPEP